MNSGFSSKINGIIGFASDNQLKLKLLSECSSWHLDDTLNRLIINVISFMYYIINDIKEFL